MRGGVASLDDLALEAVDHRRIGVAHIAQADDLATQFAQSGEVKDQRLEFVAQRGARLADRLLHGRTHGGGFLRCGFAELLDLLELADGRLGRALDLGDRRGKRRAFLAREPEEAV